MIEQLAARILLVDDEPAILDLISKIIKKQGWACDTALNTDEAKQFLGENEYFLMISDINMPGSNGIDLLRFCRKSHEDLAVIMVTAIDDRETAIQTLHLGAYGYVTKPFEPNELIINIANALRRRELEIANRNYSEMLKTQVALRTAELKQSREETIHKLAKAAEFRDNETAHHTIRMGNYCNLLAIHLGMHEEFCEKIRIAAPLHDVGKIGISDVILLKPGKLTYEEFEIIKQHSEIGYRILCDSKSDILNLGAIIALTHHEKYNGEGYPKGLKGKNIPVSGRIAAICDVFDALTSKRVYKDAMPVEQALDILREERGSHFDAEIIDVFMKNLDEILEIRNNFMDG